jgi:hypothetical protein
MYVEMRIGKHSPLKSKNKLFDTNSDWTTRLSAEITAALFHQPPLLVDAFGAWG